MMVMEEFQKVYVVASIYRGVFARAIQQFYSEDAVPMRISSPLPMAVPEVAPAVDPSAVTGAADVAPGDPGRGDLLEVPEINTELTNDLIDSLVDEASTVDFWETWGQLWVDQ